jgi:hypothetical protein
MRVRTFAGLRMFWFMANIVLTTFCLASFYLGPAAKAESWKRPVEALVALWCLFLLVEFIFFKLQARQVSIPEPPEPKPEPSETASQGPSQHSFCVECKYAVPAVTVEGRACVECRRYPPQNVKIPEEELPRSYAGIGVFSHYPLAPLYGWCGEFQSMTPRRNRSEFDTN